MLVLAAGLLAPVLFRDRIRARVETAIEQKVDAKISFGRYALSLFRSFPNMTFTIMDLRVTGTARFEADTLMTMKSFRLVLNLMSLFGDKGYEIKSVALDRPVVNAIILEDGLANWDIVKDNMGNLPEDDGDTPDQMAIKVALRSLSITDGRVSYTDRAADMRAATGEIDFNLRGEMDGAHSILAMDLAAEGVHFVMDKIQYLTDARITFEAGVDARLDSMRFTLRDNRLAINDIAFSFSGMVAMPGDDIELDMAFNTPETSFKALLSLVPAFYMKDFEDLRASGTFTIDGAVRGLYSSADSTLPDLTVAMSVTGGEISYPDLPEKITAIGISARVRTDGKAMDNTTVDISRFHFELAGNPFDMTLRLANPISDPFVKATAMGKIDLAKLQQAIPLDSVSLSGLIGLSLELSGRMSMLENRLYDQFTASGEMAFSDMTLSMNGMPGLKISEAAFIFTPAYAEMTGMHAFMGEKSDFALAGKIENYIPYLFSDGTLRGVMTLKSKSTDLNEILDILPSDTSEADTTAMDIIRVPDDIDLLFTAAIDHLLYGKLTASDVRGNIAVRDGVVSLKETGMKALGGSLLINASYDTRDTLSPFVEADLNISSADIKETFSSFNAVRQLMPAASGLAGEISIKAGFKSLLGGNMMPLLGSLSGTGEFRSQSVQILESGTFEKMKSLLKINNAYTNELKDLQARFIVNDGRIFIKPFDTRLGGIRLNISGDQGLDRTINYLIKTEIPRADLGAAAEALMATLSAQVAALGLSLTPPEIIRVNLSVAGTLTDPVISPVFAGGSGGGAVETVTAAVREEVTDRISEAAREQADRIISEAEEKSQILKDEAASLAATVRAEADSRGKKLIKDAEARGPIAVAAARKAAEALNREADKRALQLTTEADTRAGLIMSEARLKADELLK